MELFLFSYNSELNEFANWMMLNCPRHFMITSLFIELPSENGDESLELMFSKGKLYWRNLEQVVSGLPSAN